MAESTHSNGGNQLITAQNQLDIVKDWTSQLDKLTTVQHSKLSDKEKQFGVSIITNLVGRCVQGGIRANELDLTNFLEQVKHISKQQLSIAEKELYLDIRNNSKTGLKTVTISRQYQGIQKLMMRYCTKKVVRFMDGIVCTGDTFKTTTDFESGMERIISHVKSSAYDKNDWSKIQCAYAIAYVEEYGKLVPYTCIIDKRRIQRGRQAAQTDNVWRSDLATMVTKTAYWCLWAQMRPYMDLPVDMQESIAATEDPMDFSKTDDAEYVDVDTYTYAEPSAVEQPEKEYVDVEVTDHTTEPVREDVAFDEGGRESRRIPYTEYTANKEKYEKVEGSYDRANKTIEVYDKEVG